MKGTAIGLVVGSFLCFMQSFDYLPLDFLRLKGQGDLKGLVLVGIGGVFLYLAKMAWEKPLGDSED